jgi:hypothetical protein
LEKVTIREEMTGYPRIFHGHGKREIARMGKLNKRREISAETPVRFLRLSRIILSGIWLGYWGVRVAQSIIKK